ncbi:hypothetical protein Q7A36_33560, partial [Paracraurococcus sp. LOR1-02]
MADINIRIGADTSQAKAAVTDTLGQFRQLEQVLERTGNAGKRMADVDWNAGGLEKFAADADRARKAMDDLRKMRGSNTADLVRAVDQSAGRKLDPVEFYRQSQKAFPNEDARSRVLDAVGRQVFAGTQWEPAPRRPVPVAKPAAAADDGKGEPPQADDAAPAPKPAAPTPPQPQAAPKPAPAMPTLPPAPAPVAAPLGGDDAPARRTMEDLLAAMKASGQEGVKVRDLDYSHPAMEPFAKDLPAAQRRFAGIGDMPLSPLQDAWRQMRRGHVAEGGRRQDFDLLDAYQRRGEVGPKHAATFDKGASDYLFHGTGLEIGEPATPRPPGDAAAPPPAPAAPAADKAGTPPAAPTLSATPGQKQPARPAAESLRTIQAIDAALAKAGQSGKKLAEIDFRRGGLAELREPLEEADKAMRRLMSSGAPGTGGSTLRRMAAGRESFDVLDAMRGHDAQFRSPEAAAQSRTNLNGSLFRPAGFVLQASAPPPAVPTMAGGGGGGGRRRGGKGGAGGGQPPRPGRMRRLASGMASGLGAGLGLGAIGSIASMASTLASKVSEGIGSAKREAIDTNQLGKLLGDTSTDFDALRNAVRQTADGLHITYDAAQRLSAEWVKQTGERKAERAEDGVATAGAFARSYGLDGDRTNRAFARASFMGEDPKRYAMLIAEATQAAGMGGQTDRLVDVLSRFQEQAARQGTNTPEAMEEYARLFSTMAAGQKDGTGLRGADLAGILERANQTITGGGGMGLAGQVLTAKALYREGINDPYIARETYEGGLFGRVPTSGRTVLDTMHDAAVAQGQGYDRAHANDIYTNALLGANAPRREGYILRKAVEDMRTLPGGVSAFGNRLAQAGIGTEDGQQAPKVENLPALTAIMREDDAALRARRDRQLARTDGAMNAARDQLQPSKAWEGSTEDLRSALLRAANTAGEKPNQGQQAQDQQADATNALARAGQGLLQPVLDLQKITTAGIDAAGKLTAAVDKLYGSTVGGVERGLQQAVGAPARPAPTMEERRERMNARGAQHIPDAEWNAGEPGEAPAAPALAPTLPAPATPQPAAPRAAATRPTSGGLAQRARERNAEAARERQAPATVPTTPPAPPEVQGAAPVVPPTPATAPAAPQLPMVEPTEPVPEDEQERAVQALPEVDFPLPPSLDAIPAPARSDHGVHPGIVDRPERKEPPAPLSDRPTAPAAVPAMPAPEPQERDEPALAIPEQTVDLPPAIPANPDAQRLPHAAPPGVPGPGPQAGQQPLSLPLEESQRPRRSMGDRMRRLFGVTPKQVAPDWRPLEGDPVPQGWSAPGWAEQDGRAVAMPQAPAALAAPATSPAVPAPPPAVSPTVPPAPAAAPQEEAPEEPGTPPGFQPASYRGDRRARVRVRAGYRGMPVVTPGASMPSVQPTVISQPASQPDTAPATVEGAGGQASMGVTPDTAGLPPVPPGIRPTVLASWGKAAPAAPAASAAPAVQPAAATEVPDDEATGAVPGVSQIPAPDRQRIRMPGFQNHHTASMGRREDRFALGLIGGGRTGHSRMEARST